jgi:hypothetical protein
MSDAKFVRCYVKLFLEGCSYENPEENQVRFVAGAQLCHEHEMSATTINFFFVKTKNGPRKRELFCMKFDCYYLDQARTWPRPEHYLCYQAQSWPLGWVGLRPGGQAQAHTDLFTARCGIWHQAEPEHQRNPGVGELITYFQDIFAMKSDEYGSVDVQTKFSMYRQWQCTCDP